MSMSFNQFTKELRDRGVDPRVAYFLSILYERQIDLGKQMEECAKICETLADATSKMLVMSQADQKHLSALIRQVNGHKADGVDIHTEHVTNDPGKD